MSAAGGWSVRRSGANCGEGDRAQSTGNTGAGCSSSTVRPTPPSESSNTTLLCCRTRPWVGEASPGLSSCCGSACEEEDEEEEEERLSLLALGGGVTPLAWAGGTRCWQVSAESGLFLCSLGPATGRSVLGAGSMASSSCFCC